MVLQFRYILLIAGIWTHVGADVNLTRHLTRAVTWKHVKDIELYDTVGAKFAYCSGTRHCTLEKGVKSPPKFQNRLKEKYFSIILTGMQEDDEGLEIRVEIHLTGSVHRAFTLRIRLRAPPGEFLLELNVKLFFPFNKSLSIYELDQLVKIN